VRRLRLLPDEPRAGLSVAGVLLLATALALPARAQTPAANADAAPLARYAPKDGLLFYAEFDGLDAHADAWQKTSAYKILNDTTTGAMLEDLVLQGLGKLPGPAAALPWADVLTGVKHVAHAGVLLALAHDAKADAKDKEPFRGVVVLRGAARKEVRPLFARLLGAMMGPNGKPQSVAKGSRKVVAVAAPGPQGGKWIWWIEKEDLVIAPWGDKDADAIIETLDGKRPNAAEAPLRAELMKAEGEFQPALVAFADAEAVPQIGEMGVFFANLRRLGIKRLDYRWGFEDKALMSVTRAVIPRPRKGLLALLDQPTFGLKDLPPMPAATDQFVVASISLPKLYDGVVALARQANPDSAERVEAFAKTFKDRSRLRLREDVLARLGPKMAYYIAPGPGAKPATGTSGRPAANNPMAALAGAGAVGFQVPRFVVLMEVADVKAFAKAFDELILTANREIKAAMPAAPEAGGEGQPREKGAARRGGAAAAVPEFKITSSQPKTFVLSLPPALGALTNLRLTVALGKKYLVLASAPDVARQALALEASKPDARWSPGGEVKAALDRLPTDLVMLQVNDPSNTLPQAIATLPTDLQALIAKVQAAQQPAVAGAGAAPGAAPGSGSGLTLAGPTVASGPPPGYGGSSGSGMAAPGAGGAGAGPVTFQIDPAKIPKAEALKGYLFPASSALIVDDQEIRLTGRAAFPEISASTGGVSAAMLMPAIQSARDAARRAAGQAVAPAPGAAPAAVGTPGAGGNGPAGGPGAAGGPPGGRGMRGRRGGLQLEGTAGGGGGRPGSPER
jgi:hypothetical protein